MLSWLRPSHHCRSSYRLRADVWVHGLMSGWQLQLTNCTVSSDEYVGSQLAVEQLLIYPGDATRRFIPTSRSGANHRGPANIQPMDRRCVIDVAHTESSATDVTRTESSATDVVMRMRVATRDAPHVRRATREMSCHQRCVTCTPSH